MSGGISNINRLVPGLIEKIQPRIGMDKPEPVSSGGGFSDMLSNLVESVNETQQQAGEAQQALLAGEPIELHEVMIKAEEAGLSMDLLLEIRNRLVNAYNEIMRMPV